MTGLDWNKISKNSNGGTELMMRGLESRLPADLLSNFQIVPSRVMSPLDETKIRILWLHDTEDDPAASHLANGGWKKFHRLVFVSHHQRQSFIKKYDIPWSRTVVLQNAIVPIPQHEKPDPAEGVRLIYTSTPHRGLNILHAVFTELAKKHEDVTLDVFSSFKLYGWEERDKAFEPLYDALRSHPRINYHGAVSNDEIRSALQQSHVFAYPSTWPETSCLCLIEAMSADLHCVHPDYGALYETAANWTVMYPYHEVPEKHAGVFMSALEVGVENARKARKSASSQKTYTDLFYNWDLRAGQWRIMLSSLLDEDRTLEKDEKGSEAFTYSVG